MHYKAIMVVSSCLAVASLVGCGPANTRSDATVSDETEVVSTTVNDGIVEGSETAIKNAEIAVGDAVDTFENISVNDFVQPQYKNVVAELTSTVDGEGRILRPLTVVATRSNNDVIEHYLVLCESSIATDSNDTTKFYVLADYDMTSAESAANVLSTITPLDIAGMSFVDNFALNQTETDAGWRITPIGETPIPHVNVELQDAIDACITNDDYNANVVYGPICDGTTDAGKTGKVYLVELIDTSGKMLPEWLAVVVTGDNTGAIAELLGHLDLGVYIAE